jgi:hypothetical protein
VFTAVGVFSVGGSNSTPLPPLMNNDGCSAWFSVMSHYSRFEPILHGILHLGSLVFGPCQPSGIPHITQVFQKLDTFSFLGERMGSAKNMKQSAEYTRIGKVGPANQNGCVILCVGNLADEKF